MFFKKLFYAAAAVLMLALAYHLGASTATAQATANPVAAMAWAANSSRVVAITQNGDAYASNDSGNSWSYLSNCFGVSPTPTSQSSWGALKVQSR